MPSQTVTPPPELDKLSSAIAAFKEMSPDEQQQYAPKLQQYALKQYNAMYPSGYFATPEGQEVGHALRLNFGIKDASQGQNSPSQRVNTLNSVLLDPKTDQAITDEANSFWAKGGISPIAPRQTPISGKQMGQNMASHIAALRGEQSTSPASAWAQGAGEGLAQVGSTLLTQGLAVARLPGMVANQVGGGSGANFDPLADVGGNIQLPGGVNYDASTTPTQIKQFGHTLIHPSEDPLQWAGAVASLALPALHMPILRSTLKIPLDMPTQAEVYERSNPAPLKPQAEPAVSPAPPLEPAPKITPSWRMVGPDMYSAPGGFHVSSEEGGTYSLYDAKGRVLSSGHATPADAMDAIPSHATQPRQGGRFAGPPAPIEPPASAIEPQPFEGQQHSVIGGPTMPPSKTAQAIANRAFPEGEMNALQEPSPVPVSAQSAPGDSGPVGQGVPESGSQVAPGARQPEAQIVPPVAYEAVRAEGSPQGAPAAPAVGPEAVGSRLGMTEEDLNTQAAKYAGGINIRRTSLEPDQIERVQQRAKALGLDDKKPVSDEDADAMAKSLGLSYDDMRGRPAGHVPPAPEGFTPEQWQKTWVRAIKGLHDQSEIDVSDAQNAVKEAEEAHGEAPTPETQSAIDAANQKYAEANDNADLMTVHRSKLGSVSGVGLQAHVAPSVPIRGEGIRQGLLDAPTFDEVPPEAPEAAPTPKAVRKGTNRASKFAPTTDEEFNAAVARTKARVGSLAGFAKEFVKSEEGSFDFGQLPEAVRDLATIGKYYLERGVSKFADWRKAVEQHSGALSDPDAEYAYQLARAARVKDIDTKQQTALKPLFAKAFEDDLGIKGTAQMMTDVGPEIRNKMIKGEDLRPHQSELYEAFQKNLKKPGTGKVRVSNDAAKAAKEIIRSAPEEVAKRKAAAAKAAATRRANRPPPTQGPPDPDTAFEQLVGAKVKGGRKAGAAVRADLESDALGRSAKAKLLAGEDMTAAEERRLGAAIDKYRRTTPTRSANDVQRQLSKTLSDYREGRIGYDSPKETAREHLMRYHAKGEDGKIDPAKAAAIGRDLAPIDNNDTVALAKIVNKHALNFSDWFDHYVLGNVLSNPETGAKIGEPVFGAHPAAISAEELRRFVDSPEESNNGVQYAIKKTKERGGAAIIDSLRHGPMHRQFTGEDIFHSHGGRLSEEPSLIATPVTRAHTAYYQFMGEYNYARGMHLEAWNEATDKGLTGKARTDYVETALKRPTRNLVKKAIEFAHEEAQTNPSRAADATKQYIHSLRQPFRAVGTLLFPVLRVIANSFARSIEMLTGSFMSKQLTAIWAKDHPTASPEQITRYQRKILLRGRIGAGMMLTGGIGKAIGVLNEPDQKKGRYTTTLNVGGKEIDLPAGNVGAMFGIGASAVAQAQKYMNLPPEQKGFENMARGAVNTFVPPMTNDMPYVRNIDTLKAIQDWYQGAPGSEKPMSNLVAGFGSEITPWSGMMNFGAKIGDPLHAVRGYQNPTPIEAWARNMPILHNMEPTVNSPITGQPYQQSLWHMRPQEILTPEQQAKQANMQKWTDDLATLKDKLMQQDRSLSDATATYRAHRMLSQMMQKSRQQGSKW